METGDEEKFDFYPSNPCFEFWLLMHYEDVHELDEERLLANPHITKNCRYAETELRKRMPDYKKSRYNADTLLDRIDTALANACTFCQDEEQLEHTIGSRIGLLIQDLRGQAQKSG